MMIATDPGEFVIQATTATRVALVPEVRLQLAVHPQRIFQAAEQVRRAGDFLQPYWAFAWPGGQALARYILDHPDEVRGLKVLDVGSGSGIAAIAAMKAGAAEAFAADIDPMAAIAIKANARINDVEVATTTLDVLGVTPQADVVLVADLVYEPELAMRMAGWLELLAAQRRRVIMADRTTARRPPLAFELMAEYEAPLTPELLDFDCEKARVWRLHHGHDARSDRRASHGPHIANSRTRASGPGPR